MLTLKALWEHPSLPILAFGTCLGHRLITPISVSVFMTFYHASVPKVPSSYRATSHWNSLQCSMTSS